MSRGGRGLSVLPLVPKACAEGRGGLGDPEFSCFVCNGFTGMRVTTQEAHPFQRLSAVLPRAAMAPVNQVQHMSIPLLRFLTTTALLFLLPPASSNRSSTFCVCKVASVDMPHEGSHTTSAPLCLERGQGSLTSWCPPAIHPVLLITEDGPTGRVCCSPGSGHPGCLNVHAAVFMWTDALTSRCLEVGSPGRDPVFTAFPECRPFHVLSSIRGAPFLPVVVLCLVVTIPMVVISLSHRDFNLHFPSDYKH